MSITKLIFILLTMNFIIGCTTAPKPRECIGEFRPVNIPSKSENQGER